MRQGVGKVAEGRWVKGLFLAPYLACISITNVISPFSWLPIPLFVLMLFAGYYIYKNFIGKPINTPITSEQDKAILIFLVLICVSTAFNGLLSSEALDEKQVSHLLSYLVVIIFYYFALKVLLIEANANIDLIIKGLTASIVLVSIFAIIEFIGKNFLGFNVDDIIPHTESYQYNPLFEGLAIRARGFMSESGMLALCLEIFVPVLIQYWFTRKQKLFSIFLIFVSITALLLSFSAAAVAALFVGITIAFLYYIVVHAMRGRLGNFSKIILSCYIFAIFALPQSTMNTDNKVVSGISEKLTLSGGTSVLDREARWSNMLKLFADSPLIGKGAGGFMLKSDDGATNWWLQLLVEGGVPSIIVIVIFFAFSYKSLFTMQTTRKYAYMISLSAAFVHYSVVSDYWMPWLWLLVLMIQLDAGELESKRPAASPVQAA